MHVSHAIELAVSIGSTSAHRLHTRNLNDEQRKQSSDLKIRPLDDRVVVEPLEAEEKTAGGILLPDTAKQKPQRGRVAGGRPRQAAATTASAPRSASPRATKSSTASTPAPTSRSNGKEIKILRESDILAKVVK